MDGAFGDAEGDVVAAMLIDGYLDIGADPVDDDRAAAQAGKSIQPKKKK